MPTMPAFTSNWNWRAAPPSRVKIAVPLPYGFSLISLTASSYVLTRTTVSTGPKISSRYASIVGRDVVDQRHAQEEAVASP